MNQPNPVTISIASLQGKRKAPHHIIHLDFDCIEIGHQLNNNSIIAHVNEYAAPAALICVRDT